MRRQLGFFCLPFLVAGRRQEPRIDERRRRRHGMAEAEGSKVIGTLSGTVTPPADVGAPSWSGARVSFVTATYNASYKDLRAYPTIAGDARWYLADQPGGTLAVDMTEVY